MRCRLCPGVHQCLSPHGPQNKGGILFIGEAPGKTEEARGTVFVGKTGEEVDRHYLPLAGLRREAVCFTNAVACLPASTDGKLDPKSAKDTALLECCAEQNLYPLIERMRPRVIVPLGNFACRTLIPDFDLELRHGLPVQTAFGPAFPMYHPALGMHEPKKMIYIRNDWNKFRKFLAGTLQVPVDAYADNTDYREIEHAWELEELDPTMPLGADTETDGLRDPFCLTYSQVAGTGRLIRAEREDLLAGFQSRIRQWESPILFHNWLFDWDVTERMGLTFPHKRMVDTMVLVYHLGNLPQGLKALAFRELGMAMQDFDDVVTPYSKQRVLEYYRMAYAETWVKPEAQMVRDPAGNWKVYKPQAMSTKLKRFFTDYGKNPDKDVFKMWTDNWVDQQAEIEERVGKWPGKDIRHAPFEDVLFYACRDSDAVLRLYPLVKKMGTLTRRFAQELWREKAS